MSQINRASYEKLIREDIEWLKTCPSSLERSHIEVVLNWSVAAAYAPRPTRMPCGSLENCVEMVEYNSRQMVVIKQPASVRHPQGGAITKIECTLEEVRDLLVQLQRAIDDADGIRF